MHKWTEEEREYVRVNYAHTHASRRAIARILGVTEFGVAGQLSAMGICKRTDRHSWTPREDNRLTELLPCYNARKVAKMMHRSLNSIVLRAKRLGLHRRTRYGWFTKKEACEILGVDHHWLQRRIDSGELEATYHNGHKPSKLGLAMWHIDEKDLKAFIRRYPYDLNGRNVDMMQIVEVLVGVG